MVNPLSSEPGPDGSTCRGCVWRKAGRHHDRCLRHRGARVQHDWPACVAYTVALDCLRCGACCREAYHAVEVSRRDPYRRLHPDRVVELDGRLNIPRTPANWCMNLGEDYTCAVYGDRPRTCRDFEQGGSNCVEARRRVGLTR
jgi:hypothetical protein